MDKKEKIIIGLGLLGLYLILSKKMRLNEKQVNKILAHAKINHPGKYNSDFKNWGIVGVRGAELDSNGNLRRVDNKTNFFNDLLILIKGKNSLVFTATIDPGKPYILNPINSKGTFRIQPGFYEYENGLHGGKLAFVARSLVTGLRDSNKDGVFDHNDSLVNVGRSAGINIHATSRWLPKLVQYASAGCSAIADHWDSQSWKLFRDTLRNSGQKKYCYMVADSKDLIL